MKKLFTISMLFILFVLKVNAQTCTITVNSSTHRLLNDTTIISNNSNLLDSYMPCKTLKIDSAITVVDTIYLRTGTKFITDSLSTLFGGYIIYAQDGATVDMNFKNWILLYYTPGTVLIDTPMSGFSKVLCSNIVFDYSSMIEDHNCSVVASASSITPSIKPIISTTSDSWIVDLNYSQEKEMRCEVYNVQGQLVYSNSKMNSKHRIPNAQFQQGIYILKLSKGHESTSVKLIRS